ncbi:lactonase family protein [Actinospica acidithermotolerans]|uniref:lactonase family protein n=1 Tax=Actinospica acidithermotolerans TaxID=2828514 RepID=UPI0027DBF19B|nr:lactonase family protein [Actinospica acidithermotolerans]
MPRELVYVGAWQGTQVFAAWFDPAHGTLDPVGAVADITSNWTTTHPTLPVLYVAGADLAGSVTPYTIDAATGALTPHGAAVGTAPSNTAGGGLAFITVDQPSNTLLVANFAAGLAAAIPIERDGTLAALASSVQDTGSGPNPRQTGPHAHDTVVSPDGRYVLIPDFGADRVFIRRFDRKRHELSADGVPGDGYYATAAGSGPRRIVFHPGGHTAYLVNELAADIQTLAWDPTGATLTLRQDLSTDSAAFTGTKSAAELAINRDGRFVYVSNRGENTLLVYAADPATGLLTLIQRTAPGGTSPWSFALHSSGRWLLVANLVSDTVNVFSVDQSVGTVTDTGASVSIPSPDCITFAAVRT